MRRRIRRKKRRRKRLRKRSKWGRGRGGTRKGINFLEEKRRLASEVFGPVEEGAVV